MDEEKRYYVSDNGDSIIEYPAKIAHTRNRTFFDAQTDGSGFFTVQPEHIVAHNRDMFRLHNSIAEAAIESWEVFRLDDQSEDVI